VLGRDVRLRHGYLERQAARLTGDTTFLADEPAAVGTFAEQVHRRSGSDLRIWFVRKILTALGPVFADPSQDLLQRRGVQFLRAFLLADDSVPKNWDAANDLPDHPDVLPGVLAHKDLFAQISDHAKDIVINVLVQRAPADPLYVGPLWRLKEDGALATRHLEQVVAILESLPLNRIAGRGAPLAAYWTKVVAGLASHSWDSQNAAIIALRNAGPDQVAGLDGAAQEELGRQVMQAAEGTAWRAASLLGDLATSNPPWPAKLIEGAAVEPFLALDGRVRLKPREAARALRGLASVDRTQRDAVIDRIRDGIASGELRDPSDFARERKETIDSIERVASESGMERAAEIVHAIDVKAPLQGEV
jgi:hypothetical protein